MSIGKHELRHRERKSREGDVHTRVEMGELTGSGAVDRCARQPRCRERRSQSRLYFPYIGVLMGTGVMATGWSLRLLGDVDVLNGF